MHITEVVSAGQPIRLICGACKCQFNADERAFIRLSANISTAAD